MVRTAFLTFLLITLVATSAMAARITPQRPRVHATIGKSTVHRSRRLPAHVARSKSNLHPIRKSSRSAAVVRRARRAPAHPATVRRARYNPRHSKAHLVPVATSRVSKPSSSGSFAAGSSEELDDSASTTIASAERVAARPRHETSVEDQSVAPAGLSAEQGAVSREMDTLPPPGTDPAVAAAAGNPLAAPSESRPPLAASAGQVAELTRPPLFSGRVSSYTLRGTHDSLVRQNARSEEENLERIENDADLQDRIDRGLLVRVPESAGLAVNPTLPDNRRYCRPWTADFLADLARAHHAQFHTPLVVSSAVRTVEYQMHLMRVNGNAADAEGDVVSPHLTGATIDIAKSGLSRRELQWMRSRLVAYQNAGVIDVEEEFHQRCFHITVYKNYGTGSSSRRSTEAAGATATPVTDGQDAPSATAATPDNR